MVAKWAESAVASASPPTRAWPPIREVDALLAGEVEKVNASLPEAQRIRRYLLLYKELDPDDGELTRTRKVRRAVIDERYRQLIDAIYAGQDRVHIATEVTFEDGRSGRLDAEL